MRYLYLFLYYFICKNLPRSYEFGVLGKLSNRSRSFMCRRIFKAAPSRIFVERGADFGGGRNIMLNECACIGENARFIGKGRVIIGKHAMMGPDVMIITSDHKMEEDGFFKGYVSKDVEIGDYAWIGARAIILKGVKIGKYAIVGAGAVVTKDVPDQAVVGGSPARILKYRNEVKENVQNVITRY